MLQNQLKILFLHGLDSSRESTKFHAIQSTNKFCIDVDYRNLNYDTVASFYQNIIQSIRPDILIGHSLGGYWALKLSSQYQLATIVANPSLTPHFRDDYPPILPEDLDNDIPRLAYLELGDEVIDMRAVQSQLENYMLIDAIEGGHHRLEQPEKINHLIQHIQKQYFK
ncbi:alpha/beta fold hydrolase [Acinetobacter guerrae]|uniref:Alpha/beta fold hydrolase n=1 Tax=Acinetobacter guerrae TaxID=1843371 RepID=A0A3A8ELL1_9GAMM|nr:YqiA/YcfP family alpha/beta fold hydrolase [Acinetobacter guerrae]RKG35019.1 alpha/beta fold hydrolase [Acinetobacter guerrae]